MNYKKLIQLIKKNGARVNTSAFRKAGAGVLLVGGATAAAYAAVRDDDEREVLPIVDKEGAVIEGKRVSLSERILDAADGIDITQSELLEFLKDITADIDQRLFPFTLGILNSAQSVEAVSRIMARNALNLLKTGADDAVSQLDYANLMSTISLLQYYGTDADRRELNAGDIADTLIAGALADPYLKASQLNSYSAEDIEGLIENTRDALISAINKWCEDNDISTAEWRAVEYGAVMYECLVSLNDAYSVSE